MKTMGLLGGMSWESSVEYYRIANEQVKARLGGHHSAKIVLYSVDFAEIEKYQQQGQWEEAGRVLAEGARALERAGAEVLILCTNTMHKLAAQIKAAIHVPFLHIAEATGQEIVARGLKTVGLLGTRYTMEQDFYKGTLAEMGLEVIVPPAEERQVVHEVIYGELCLGTINPASRERYRQIMEGLVQRGAQAIIFGCTEITLLSKPEDVRVPVFDTTRIHALKAVEFCLGSQS